MNWDHALPAVDRLKDALQHDLNQALHSKIIARIQIALGSVEEALPTPGELGGDPRVLAKAVDDLEQSVQELDDFCYRRAIAAFGVWGAYCFTVAANSQFSLDDCNRWPLVILPAEEIVALMNKPPVGESEQEWADAAEACDQWIYEQVMSKVKYDRIITELKSKPMKWRRISSIPGIKAVASRYAERHSLPKPEPREPGRPAGP